MSKAKYFYILGLIALSFLFHPSSAEAKLPRFCDQILVKIREYFSPFSPDRLIQRDWSQAVQHGITTPGMILKTREQIYQSIEVFINRESRSQSINEFIKSQSDGGTNALAFLSKLGGPLASLKMKSVVATIEKLIDAADASENNYNYYKNHHQFDYDAFMTPFFKTGLTIRKLEGVYIVSFSASYVGNKPTTQVAEKIKAPLAMSAIEIRVPVAYSETEAQINLGEALGKLFPQRIARTLAARTVFNESQSEGIIPTLIKINDMKLDLTVKITQDHVYQSLPTSRSGSILKAKIMEVNSQSKYSTPEEPTVYSEPYLLISLRKPGSTSYSKDAFISDEERYSFQAAANKLIETLNIDPIGLLPSKTN